MTHTCNTWGRGQVITQERRKTPTVKTGPGSKENTFHKRVKDQIAMNRYKARHE